MHLGSRPHQRPREEQLGHDAGGPRLRRMRPPAVDEARKAVNLVLPTLQKEARLRPLQHARRRADGDLPSLRARRALASHEEVVRDSRGVPDGVWLPLSGNDIEEKG